MIGELLAIFRLRRICREYRIPFRDLPEVFEEYVYQDNVGWSIEED